MAERARQVEERWQGSIAISPAGHAFIQDFTRFSISEQGRFNFPPGLDDIGLLRQLDVVVPLVLEEIRREADVAGGMRRMVNGQSQIPDELIRGRLPVLTSQRCACWPQ